MVSTHDNLHGQHIGSVPYYYLLFAFEHKDISDPPFIINSFKTHPKKIKNKRLGQSLKEPPPPNTWGSVEGLGKFIHQDSQLLLSVSVSQSVIHPTIFIHPSAAIASQVDATCLPPNAGDRYLHSNRIASSPLPFFLSAPGSSFTFVSVNVQSINCPSV